MRLKEIRQQKNLTQAEVARLLHCTEGTYARYEKGDREPSLEMLQNMADLFMVSVDTLLGRTTRNEIRLSDKETYIISVIRKTDTRALHDAVMLLEAHIAEHN